MDLFLEHLDHLDDINDKPITEEMVTDEVSILTFDATSCYKTSVFYSPIKFGEISIIVLLIIISFCILYRIKLVRFAWILIPMIIMRLSSVINAIFLCTKLVMVS
jgi:hypothetical protein